jgi:hypothetical protein
MIGRRSIFQMILGAIAAPFAAKAAVKQQEPELPVSERFKLIYQRLFRAEEDRERLETTLAGVSTAAHGGTSDAVVCKPGEWAYHLAYQDVIDLRRKFDALVRLASESMYMGQVVALYPCGCSASGWRVDADASADLPRYCPEHDREMKRERECTLIKPMARKPPTIAELEEILASNPDPLPYTFRS